MRTPCEIYVASADWYAPPGSPDAVLAAELCQYCPMREACLRQARDNGEEWGIWGGEQFPLQVPLCPNGHPATRENRVARPSPTQPNRTMCRECERDTWRRSQARRQAKNQ